MAAGADRFPIAAIRRIVIVVAALAVDFPRSGQRLLVSAPDSIRLQQLWHHASDFALNQAIDGADFFRRG